MLLAFKLLQTLRSMSASKTHEQRRDQGVDASGQKLQLEVCPRKRPLMFICLAVTLPTGIVVLGAIALTLITAYLLGGIFGASPRYHITGADKLPPNDSSHFLFLLESLVDAKANRSGDLEVLPNGPRFYPAVLEAIRSAQRSVNLEAYVFQKGDIARLYLEAMTERARAGVQVNLVLDAFGSIGATRSFFRPLVEAGGKFNRYKRLPW